MLISMTGHGAATQSDSCFEFSIELRSVNHRHFKANYRLPEFLNHSEVAIEKLLKKKIRRGSVQVHVRCVRIDQSSEHVIDTEKIEALVTQLQTAGLLESTSAPPLASLLQLPGILTADRPERSETLDQLLLATMNSAVDSLELMRNAEGQESQATLMDLLSQLQEQLAQIESLSPDVVTSYQEKLIQRIDRLTALKNISIDSESPELIREVAIFADKCDITEEITRLKSHFGQFRSECDANPGSGRKLDFLVQEMFREANTIGSKANNETIAHRVVEMKAIIERIREIIQNVE